MVGVQSRGPRWRDPARACGIESVSVAEQRIIVIGSSREGETDRHADVTHEPHCHCHRRDAEMAEHLIAIGDPYAIAPSNIIRDWVVVRVVWRYVSGGRKHHRIESICVKPTLKIEPASLL